MNANSCGVGYQGCPAYVALAGTAVQKVPWTFNNTPALSNQFASSPSALFVQVPPDLAVGATFDGHPFVVRAVGKVFVATTATVTVSIYNDSSMTATSGNIIASSGAGPSVTGSATAACNFYIEAKCLWDSSALVLTGQQNAAINVTAGTQTTVIGTALTNAKSPANLAALVFSLGVTYSAGNTGSNVFINEFSVERV